LANPKNIINQLLVDVFNHILTIEETSLKKKGITLSMTEVHVLEAIRNTKTPTMGNVARQVRVTLGTLSTSINILVRKRYVYRYTDEKDRRKVFLKLTDSALEVLKLHDSFHDEMIDAVFKDLKLEEDLVLIKSLENIKDYFKDKY